MKRIGLSCILLFLSLSALSAQNEDFSFIGGLRLGRSFVPGIEAGLIFHDRIGIEFFADGTMPRMSPASNSDKDFEKQLGKRYHLLYGGAVLIRTYGALWLDVCAGYGWTGIMAWDEMENRLGLRKGLKGLSAGLGLHYFLGDYFFVSAGYNSIIRGFMANRPDHNFYFGVGMRF